MELVYIPQEPFSGGIVFPIIAEDRNTGNTTVLGKIAVQKYGSQYSPMVSSINIKEEFKRHNVIMLLVLEALYKRFGNYIISGEVEIPLGLYKILVTYLTCKVIPEGLLFTKYSHEILAVKIREAIYKRK